MRRLFQSFLMLVFSVGILTQAHADHLSPKYLFAARINGAQEVPAVTTQALGVASVTLNHTGDTLCITATVNGLSGPITGIHIHDGKPGVPGPVVKDLMPFLSGNAVQATLTGSGLSGLSMAKMFAGDYYINVHTAANPSGEIRGQILLEQDRGMMVRLTGAEEVPAVTTNAKGLAFFMLSQHNGKLNFHVVLDSLNGTITGAHLHRNIAGANGPIVQDLMPFLSGNVISGTVDPSAYMNALLSDSLYINVHTSPNPAGLIRGQLRLQQPYLHFDARMNGAQEVPAVTTNAQGLGVLRMNFTMDTVWYEVQMTGLSGAVSAAHIHRGAVGVAGPVLVGFPTATISGNTISGFAPIPAGIGGDTLKRLLLEGNLYINVHTALNPPGEIRGQVYRTAREGYTFALSGNGEPIPVSTPAYGSGMVSVDRDQTNAHFMIAATGITPTAAHFHQGIPGTNGPVIFDLAPYMANGGIYGYWLDNGSPAFSAAFSNKFRKDSVYVNMHTTANPGGEIRGQTLRMLCTPLPAPTASVRNVSGPSDVLTVYPNPTNDAAQLVVQIGQPTQAVLRLCDVAGRIVWQDERTFTAGEQVVILPVKHLPAGTYSIHLITGGGAVTRKLVKD